MIERYVNRHICIRCISQRVECSAETRSRPRKVSRRFIKRKKVKFFGFPRREMNKKDFFSISIGSTGVCILLTRIA